MTRPVATFLLIFRCALSGRAAMVGRMWLQRLQLMTETYFLVLLRFATSLMCSSLC